MILITKNSLRLVFNKRQEQIRVNNKYICKYICNRLEFKVKHFEFD